MKKLNIYFYICMAIAMIALTGCHHDDEPERLNWEWKQSPLCHKLVGTSWILDSTVYYWYDGSIAKREGSDNSCMYTLTDINYDKNYSIFDKWEYYEMRRSRLNPFTGSIISVNRYGWYLDGDNLCGIYIEGEIVSLTDSELQLKTNKKTSYYDYYIEYYKRVAD